MNTPAGRYDAIHRAVPLLARHAAPRGLRHVTPSVEMALKLATLSVLVGLFVFTYTWGLSERRRAEEWRARAEAWQTLACEYQLRDVERRLPLVASPGSGTACERLARLGLTTVVH